MVILPWFFRLSLCSGAPLEQQSGMQWLRLLSSPTLADFRQNGDQKNLCKRNPWILRDKWVHLFPIKNKTNCRKIYILHQRTCFFRVRPMNICCLIFTFNSPPTLVTYLWAHNLLQVLSSQPPLFPQNIFVSCQLLNGSLLFSFCLLLLIALYPKFSVCLSFKLLLSSPLYDSVFLSLLVPFHL